MGRWRRLREADLCLDQKWEGGGGRQGRLLSKSGERERKSEFSKTHRKGSSIRNISIVRVSSVRNISAVRARSIRNSSTVRISSVRNISKVRTSSV